VSTAEHNNNVDRLFEYQGVHVFFSTDRNKPYLPLGFQAGLIPIKVSRELLKNLPFRVSFSLAKELDKAHYQKVSAEIAVKTHAKRFF